MGPFAGHPSRRCVARRAIVGCWNVRGNFSNRRNTIVTTRAVGRVGKFGMVHARRGQPGFCGMALAAGDFGHNVAKRLSRLNNTVVTTCTGRWRYADVVKTCAGKSTGGVAGTAGKRRLKVIGRSDDIGLGLNGPFNMAGRTGTRSSEEHAIFVARLALCAGMDAGKREAGSQVVKVAGRLGKGA